MIMQPLHIYLQRLIATYSIWGILIVLMLWLPLEVIRRTIPGFLPYQINVAHESPFDYSVEIILIQVVLPFLLDAHAKATVRQWLRGWCVLVSWLLNIRSFLLGDVPLEPGDLIITEDGVEMPYNPPGTYGTYSVAPEQGQSFSTEQLWQEEHNSRPSEAAVPLPHPEVRPDQPHANAQQQPQHGPRGDEEGDEDLSRFMPYKRTSLFTLRLTGLLVIVLISLMLLSAILLVCPVGLGRLVFTLINVTGTQKHDAVALVTGFTLLGLLIRVASCLPALLRSVHRSLSAFLLWFSHLFCWSRRLHVLRIWTRSGTTCEIAIPRPALPAPVRTITSLSTSSNSATETGAENICPTAKFTRACAGRLYVVSRVTFQALRLGCVALILLVLLPVAIGLLVNLVFITPFKVAPRKTLIFGFWEHWIFGIMHLKVTVLITMASPSSWLRRRLEAVQNELITHRYNARSSRILSETAPLILIIGLSLAAPYLLSHYVWSWIYHYPEFSLRYLYPGTFGLVVAIFSCWFHIKQLQKLYVRIKDEKYLVGRRLVNCGSEEPGDDSQALTLSTNHAV
ncbi:putative ssm4 protein [Fasciola gigantica]|uniref:RING-type E3 ubiquitin transferase n=1 Tax=Fasciola gigantica TaxID=46835 RepID=A0A504YM19_FASGI|nr:putative ssm4 protein [Fasciola gigantica]